MKMGSVDEYPSSRNTGIVSEVPKNAMAVRLPNKSTKAPKKGPANMLHMYTRLARREAD